MPQVGPTVEPTGRTVLVIAGVVGAISLLLGLYALQTLPINYAGLALIALGIGFLVAEAFIPSFGALGLGGIVAFVLGAVVSPTDAVAATAIAQRLGVPRRIVVILEGESLVNDATGLVAFRVAAAVVAGTAAFSLADAGLQFVVGTAGGVLLGVLTG